MDDLFPQQLIDGIRGFYASYEPCRAIDDFRTLKGRVGKVRNVFYGDSITAGWPVQEFFPSHSVLNRGIGGDNVVGLHLRLQEDVFDYEPERVFMMIGINGIGWPEAEHVARIVHVAEEICAHGIRLWLGSILPLRFPDKWDRFQYQGRIVSVNATLRAWCEAHGCGYLDYHSAVKDETGQLKEEFARPDGTHIKFGAYVKMSEIVAPYLA